MQNFIVLGMIPGTHIQFSFTAWLAGCIGLLVVSILLHERRALRIFLLSHYIAHHIKKQLAIVRPAILE